MAAVTLGMVERLPVEVEHVLRKQQGPYQRAKTRERAHSRGQARSQDGPAPFSLGAEPPGSPGSHVGAGCTLFSTPLSVLCGGYFMGGPG